MPRERSVVVFAGCISGAAEVGGVLAQPTHTTVTNITRGSEGKRTMMQPLLIVYCPHCSGATVTLSGVTTLGFFSFLLSASSAARPAVTLFIRPTNKGLWILAVFIRRETTLGVLAGGRGVALAAVRDARPRTTEAVHPSPGLVSPLFTASSGRTAE